MTTDMNQTGIPSVTRDRVQISKPVQTNNTGRVAYNPIMAKNSNPTTQPTQPTQQTSSMAPTAIQQTSALPTYDDLANGVSVDQFGRYLTKLPEKDQMRFLENLANGVYKVD